MPLTKVIWRVLRPSVMLQLSPTLCAAQGVQSGLGMPGGAPAS